MKFKYFIFTIFVILLVNCTNVKASSIDYNLRIDKDLHFYETITYNVDKKDVKKDGNYHFLTSIVNDPIYFDLKETNQYTKTKKNTTSGYLVTLKYDYPHLFLSNSRIVNECFADKDFDSNNSYVSFNATDFYCSHRADNISVTITTDLQVSSNANSIEGNNYIWNNINNDFAMNARVAIPAVYNEPMDDINTDDNSINNNSSSSDTEEDNQKHHINKYVFLGIVGALLIIGFGVTIVLKTKNNDLNKI